MKRKPYRPNPYLIQPKGHSLTMSRSDGTSGNFYYNLGYWFLALIILVAGGFYTTYLSKIFQPQAGIIHFHFLMMGLWIAMLITQPFLIKYRNVALHRKVGKASYVVVPLVLLSSFLMLRYSYYNFISGLLQKATQSGQLLATAQIKQQAGGYVAIVVFWFVMFATFYALAILNRKKSAVHARYMVATALALLGPTVDRIVVFVFNLEKLPAGLPIEIVAFFVANTVLVILLWKDYQEKRPTIALRNSLLIYLLGQTLYFTVLQTEAWGYLIALIMLPKP